MPEPTVETCKFVAVSALFEGWPLAKAAFDGAGHTTFSRAGGNDRSLLGVERFQNALDDLLGQRGEAADEELEAVLDRTDGLPPDVYIDLEH